MLSGIPCISTTTQQGHCKCSPCKSVIKHTKSKINIQFINESLNCASIYLAFETLQRSGFNTPGEGFSLILGYLLFFCKPSLHLCLHRFFKFLNLGYCLGHSGLLEVDMAVNTCLALTACSNSAKHEIYLNVTFTGC